MPYTTRRGNSTTDCITAPHDSLLHHNLRYACGAPTTHKRDDAETTPTTCTGADRPARARVRPPPGVPPLRALASGAACARAWRCLASAAPVSFKQTLSSSLSVWIEHLNLVEKFASDGSFARARVRPARVRHSARVARHPVEPAWKVHTSAHGAAGHDPRRLSRLSRLPCGCLARRRLSCSRPRRQKALFPHDTTSGLLRHCDTAGLSITTYTTHASTTHKRDDAETTPTTCTGADRPACARAPAAWHAAAARACQWCRLRARVAPPRVGGACLFQTISSSHSVQLSFVHTFEFGRKILCCMRSMASARAPHRARSAPHARPSSRLSFPPPCASPPTRTRARARCARVRALLHPEQHRCTRGHRCRSIRARQGSPASWAASPAAAGVSLASTRRSRRR